MHSSHVHHLRPPTRLPSIQGRSLQGFRGNCYPRSKDDNDVALINLRSWMNLWCCCCYCTLRSLQIEAFESIQHPQRLSGCLAMHIVRRLCRFPFQGLAKDARMTFTGFSGVTKGEIRSMKAAVQGHSWGQMGKSKGLGWGEDS